MLGQLRECVGRLPDGVGPFVTCTPTPAAPNAPGQPPALAFDPDRVIEIRVDLLSNGKRMAYTRAEMTAKGDSRVAVTVTSAFAYLED